MTLAPGVQLLHSDSPCSGAHTQGSCPADHVPSTQVYPERGVLRLGPPPGASALSCASLPVGSLGIYLGAAFLPRALGPRLHPKASPQHGVQAVGSGRAEENEGLQVPKNADPRMDAY